MLLYSSFVQTDLAKGRKEIETNAKESSGVLAWAARATIFPEISGRFITNEVEKNKA